MSKKYWSPSIKSLSPYVPGEQVKGRKVTRLNTNENPFPPSPMVKEAILEVVGDDCEKFCLYPSFDLIELREEIAHYHGVKAEQVFLGNGSDEVLAHIFRALLKQNDPILCPDVSYSFYPVYCNLFEIEYKALPLADDFSIQVNDYLTAEHKNNGGIIIANPNAPTSLNLPIDKVMRLVKGNPQSVVVIDEAYVDYDGETALPYIDECPNLLVVRTFSKSRSLAGLRVGYAIGDASLIDALICVKDSFNSFPVDMVAYAAARASIKDEAYFQQKRTAVIENREYLQKELKILGFDVLPSAANFLFATHSKVSAEKIQSVLKERDILVRYFKQPRIDNHLRITVGTRQECEQLVSNLKEILNF